MKKFFALFFFSFFISHFSFSQDTAICFLRDIDGRIREHNVDFLKMKLDVKFDVKDRRVIGNVKYDFKPIQYVVDTLFLNAPDIHIKNVKLNETPQNFSSDSNGVTIRFAKSLDWNKQYKLEINYEATPRKGIYFIGWDVNAKNEKRNPYFTRKQIWTQGQGIDNRHWIPCYDDVNDKLITETIITFDSNYTVISNGVLKQKRANSDGTFTWNYAMNKPMVPYLIMIAIDKYSYKNYKSKNGNISRQYYYADRPETAEPTYKYSAEMMDWLQEQTGVKYPWETYANVPVQDFMYGAMENTTATIFGDFYLTDKRGVLDRPYYSTNAHELTHQWFGDYITEYSSAHHWLHESFATYYAKQFMHLTFGEAQYEWAKRNEHWAAINSDKRDRFAVGHSRGGSARVYPKGSAVIDMIRYVVGDSVYKKCVTNYLKKHAYGNVLNDDFKMAFMETAGINLDWFFEEWIYRAGFPQYEVSYEKQENRVAFFVQQNQTTDNLLSYFKMPVVFEVHFKDGDSVSKSEWISNAFDTVYLDVPANKEIDYTLFDPASNIIKEVIFRKSFEELSAQALRASHFIDRYDAITVMRDTAIDKKRDLFVNVFNNENYFTIKNEILFQLSEDTNAAVIELFRKALRDNDFATRKIAIDNLGSYPDEFPAALTADVELLLRDSSYNTVENTLRKLCKNNPNKIAVQKYLAETSAVYGSSNNVRTTWLVLSVNEAEDSVSAQKFLDELVEFTSNRYEFITRIRAIDKIETLKYCDESLLKNLFNAATYTNHRLSSPAKNCLKTLLNEPRNLEAAKNIFNSENWKDWERKILEPMLK